MPNLPTKIHVLMAFVIHKHSLSLLWYKMIVCYEKTVTVPTQWSSSVQPKTTSYQTFSPPSSSSSFRSLKRSTLCFEHYSWRSTMCFLLVFLLSVSCLFRLLFVAVLLCIVWVPHAYLPFFDFHSF